jgi:subtilisin family serine protease
MAQVSQQDSMVLVELYNSTNGPEWINNTNWLSSNPVYTWYGIELSPTSNNVAKIELPNNNLQNAIPNSIISIFTLDVMDVSNNQIQDLPYLGGGIDPSYIDVTNNQLTFEDFEFNTFHPYPLLIDPQQQIGNDTIVNKAIGQSYILDVNVTGSSNLYTWYKDNVQLTTSSQNSSFPLTNLTTTDSGNYQCQITSIDVTNLILYSNLTTLNVGFCTDELGGLYHCNEVVVQFNATTVTTSIKDIIRANYGGTLIDSCLCREFEIWGFPVGVDLEPKKKNIETDPDLEGTDFNYIMDLDENLQSDPSFPPPTLPGPTPTSNPVVVAIIDSGISYSHADLRDRIWKNINELGNGIDDDGNCLLDDEFGWDFVNEIPNADDSNGHGTFIAGIIVDGMGPEVQLMNLKAFDADKGDLFDVSCAIRYGDLHDVEIFNLSFGYYGASSRILENVMKNATTAAGCKPLFVVSAGNDTLDNDIVDHYPSDFTLDNLIAVAAMDTLLTDFAYFSNWGHQSVDIAAKGQDIFSTLPPNTYGTSEGTSYAAPHVVRAAAQILIDNPGMTYRGIKSSILDTSVEFVTGIGKMTTGGQLDEAAATAHAITAPPSYYDCMALVEIKALLEGPLETTLLMHDSLRTQLHIPILQPFNTAPWNYAGTEMTNFPVLSTTGPNAIVDWVLIMAYDTLAGDTLTKACLIQRDGDIIEANGGMISFPLCRDLHIAIMHRNHLAIRSEHKVSFITQPTIIDLTDGSTFIGTVGTKIIGGKTVMLSGDANADGLIDGMDYLIWQGQNGSPFGYSTTPADFNMDKSINAADFWDAWNTNQPNISACDVCY